MVDTNTEKQDILHTIQGMAYELGFAQVAVSDIDLSHAEAGLLAWLQAGFHGNMSYMQTHGLKRARPAELVPGTISVITVRMDYLPQNTKPNWRKHELQRLKQPNEAIVSVYARGRDYHKVMRKRLQQLAQQISNFIAPMGFRVFTDSAPVLEVELATRSGQGWRGKHTLLINKKAGSTFFLGEIYIDIALPPTPPSSSHCGQCRACIDICPTQAIIAPWRLDARRCISYLTIENTGSIPVELRELIGNRIYGCDDCQLICPWNKFAKRSPLEDFNERNNLGSASLLELWQWNEAEFLRNTEGSPIRRIGFALWQRNLAVALGNALRHTQTKPEEAKAIRTALLKHVQHPNEMVREHVMWALE